VNSCVNCEHFKCSAGYFYAYTAYELGETICEKGIWRLEDNEEAKELRKYIANADNCNLYQEVVDQREE